MLDLTPWMERWHMLPPPGGLILCAVSGGRDSVCLLDCLWRMGRQRDFRVAAAHLNHGMRPTAQRDEDLVRTLCAERDIPFYTERVDVYALCAVWHLTVEETGRRARYDFLRRTAETTGAAFTATAHHREDQAETVLLQLLRGTGPQGLTGIPPVRDGIIRPLLDTPRAAIDDYITGHGLPYVTDETNLDTHYARNRLRLEIMPRLLTINPAAAGHIARTADILRRENDYLDGQAAALLPPEGTALSCGTLLTAPEPLRPRMLRLMTDRLPTGKKDFTAVHYQALETLCRTGGTLSLPGGAQAVCRGGVLTLTLPDPAPDETPLRMGGNSAGPWYITLSAAPLPGALALREGRYTVRRWHRDDRLTLPGSRGERSLKRLFADRGIPPEQRDAVPVLCRDGIAAAVPGVGIDQLSLPGEPGHTIYITVKMKDNGGTNTYG